MAELVDSDFDATSRALLAMAVYDLLAPAHELFTQVGAIQRPAPMPQPVREAFGLAARERIMRQDAAEMAAEARALIARWEGALAEARADLAAGELAARERAERRASG